MSYNPDGQPEFLRVKKSDVTLKFVFDNIRNIGLAALVFSLGVIIAKGEPISALLSFPYSQVLIGCLLCFGALVLSVLNFMQCCLAILAMEKAKTWVYMMIAFLLHIGTYEMFFKIVYKHLGT